MPFVGSFTEFVIGGIGGIRRFFEFEKVDLCLYPPFFLSPLSLALSLFEIQISELLGLVFSLYGGSVNLKYYF